MDNLKFFDFLVLGRHAFCVGLCAIALASYEASAQEPIQAAAPPAAAEQAEQGEATAAVQKMQRLLKLLATRHPNRYASVDPGRVDGILGGETKVALRNFRAIAGLANDPRPDSQLTPEILSELASMSVNDGSDQGRSPAGPCADMSTAAGCSNTKPESLAAAGTPAGGSAPASTTASTAAPAKPNEAKSGGQTLRTVPRRETPAPGTPVAEAAKATDAKLYFVQVASLRSLDGANREWDRIKEANRAALQGEQVYFERANIKERGVFYRILIGPQPNREDANTLCAFLKQNDQTCVVASRTPAEIRRNAERTDQDGQQAPVAAGEESEVGSPPPAANAQGGGPAYPAAPPSADRSKEAPGEPGAAESARSPAPAKSATASEETPAPAVKPAAAAPESAARVLETESRAAVSNERGPPQVAAPSGTTEVAVSGKPAAAEEKPAAIEAGPTPVRHPEPLQRDEEPLQRNEPRNGHAAAAAPDLQNQAAPADTAARRAEAPGDAPQSQTTLASAVLAAGRRFLDGWQSRAAAAVLSALIVCAALFYVLYRRKQRAAISREILGSGLALGDLNEGQSEAGQTIARLEEDFESQQLREARLIRDDFLRHILGGNTDNAFAMENSDSAIRVNTSLKELLATDPARYKSIFLNLIFLATLGASLNRKEITPDQLNDQFGRELGLLQSCFRIHLLELDDRHRIRKELPGLFYCLQLSERLKKPKKLHFSAA